MDEDKKVALILRWGKKVKMKNSYTNTFILGGRDFWTWHLQGMAWWPYSSLWRHLPYLSMLLLFPVLLKQQQKKSLVRYWKVHTLGNLFLGFLRVALQFVSYHSSFLWSVIWKKNWKTWSLWGWMWNTTVYFKLQIKKNRLLSPTEKYIHATLLSYQSNDLACQG